MKEMEESVGLGPVEAIPVVVPSSLPMPNGEQQEEMPTFETVAPPMNENLSNGYATGQMEQTIANDQNEVMSDDSSYGNGIASPLSSVAESVQEENRGNQEKRSHDQECEDESAKKIRKEPSIFKKLECTVTFQNAETTGEYIATNPTRNFDGEAIIELYREARIHIRLELINVTTGMKVSIPVFEAPKSLGVHTKMYRLASKFEVNLADFKAKLGSVKELQMLEHFPSQVVPGVGYGPFCLRFNVWERTSFGELFLGSTLSNEFYIHSKPDNKKKRQPKRLT